MRKFLIFLAFVVLAALLYQLFKPEPSPPPQPIEIKVTIPEGFSVAEIDERLTQLKLIASGAFLKEAQIYEGFLFPDTYFVFIKNFAPADLIKKMQDNFNKKLTPDLLSEIKKQKRTLKEVITIASMTEKEVKTPDDFAIVAGILWKRFDGGWPLQVDATALYSDDPRYDTYKHRSMPPTPIGNPGIKTIKSAIFPKKTQYWFYLTDRDGNVHYARTNEEQNFNRRKYL